MTHEPGGTKGNERGQTGGCTAGIINKILFGRLADGHSQQPTEGEAAPLISARGDAQVKCRSLILRGGCARLCTPPAPPFLLVTLQSANEIINIKVEM